MIAWWEGLSILEKGLMFFAVPSTLILLLQTILLIFGMGGHDADADTGVDTHVDVDGGTDMDGHMDTDIDGHMDEASSHADAGFRIFTIRGFIAFFSVFGWTGLVMLHAEIPAAISIVVAVMAGLLAMIAIASIFKLMLHLQSSGNLNVSNAVGKTGKVYMTVPKNREGAGKVNVVIQEKFSEVEAISDCEEDIRPGTEVVVLSANNRNVLVVKPLAARK